MKRSLQACRHAGPADADHRAQPHRLWRAAQAGHQGGAWRAARRRRGAAGQAVLRLRSRCAVRRAPTACWRISARSSASAVPARTQAWNARFTAYRAQYPDLAEQIDRMQRRDLPEGWDSALPSFPADAKGLATRDASGKVLNAIAAADAVAAGRRRRPGAIDQNGIWASDRWRIRAAFWRRRGRESSAARLRRPQFSLRRARACDVRHRQAA